MATMSSRWLLPLWIAVLAACGSTPAPRDPTGEVFPTVTATTLKGDAMVLPDALHGTPAVLLVGYVMEAQFDCDRWILGLVQAGTSARVVEVPTIDGMVPGLFAGFIDEGMRGGIPRDDWGSVATVYDDAAAIVAFTGDDGSRNARVLLLDPEGKVRWFHDAGYSAGKLMELLEVLRSLS